MLVCIFSLLTAVATFAVEGVSVGNDNRATFTLIMPSARRVQLEGSFSKKPVRMICHGDTFTHTTQPLASEMYTYRYIVKGKPMLDPTNSNVTRDIDKRLNFFFVDGEIADRYMEHDVPHGRIDTIWYPSTLNGMSQRRMFVYTPHCYPADSSTTFPILFLLHGSGGDETSWTDYGRAQQILDNMIARREMPPLVVVMPNGNIELDAAPGESPYMDKQPSASNITSMAGKFETSFRHEIVDYIQRHYRVSSDKRFHAIAGLSMGGLHTLYISLNNPDLFDYVGLFSAQTSNMLDEKRIWKVERFNYNLQRARNIMALINDHVAKPAQMSDKLSCINIYDSLDVKLQRQFTPHPPRLYYIAIGREDFLQTMNAQLRGILDAHEYDYVFVQSSGGHTWENWRKYLVDFLKRMAPMLPDF